MDQIFRFMRMDLTSFETIAVWAVLGIAVIGLIYAVYLRRQILAEDKGTERMIEVWEAIRQGANAYLGRQLRTILPFIAVLTVALFLSVYIVPPTEFSREVFEGSSEGQIRLIVGLGRAIAFIMGAGFSLAVGQVTLPSSEATSLASVCTRSWRDSTTPATTVTSIEPRVTNSSRGGVLKYPHNQSTVHWVR